MTQVTFTDGVKIITENLNATEKLISEIREAIEKVGNGYEFDGSPAHKLIRKLGESKELLFIEDACYELESLKDKLCPCGSDILSDRLVDNEDACPKCKPNYREAQYAQYEESRYEKANF